MKGICYKSYGMGIETNRDLSDEETKRYGDHGSETHFA
jgi:hypothetical protein